MKNEVLKGNYDIGNNSYKKTKIFIKGISRIPDFVVNVGKSWCTSSAPQKLG